MILGIAWLDLVLVALLVVALVQGHRRGLWIVAGTLLGFVAGAAAAFYAVPFVSRWVADPDWRWVAILGVVVALVGLGTTIGESVGGWIRLHVNLPVLRRVDRVLGALASVLVASVALSMLALGLGTLGLTPVTTEVNRSTVLTVIDRAMPDAGQRWLAQSRVAAAGLNMLPEVRVPAPGDSGAAADPADSAGSDGAPESRAIPSPSTQSSPGTGAEEEPVQAAPAPPKVRESVVRLSGLAAECGQTQNGTGVVIAPDRILTNAHVVAGVDAPTVETASREVYSGRVVHLDPQRDLAVVAVDGADLPVPETDADLEPGQEAHALGFPAGGPYVETPARVQGRTEALLSDIYGRTQGAVEIYQLNAEIVPGHSGGPLVTDDGQVAGLVFARAPGSSTLGYAIAGDEYEDLVDRAAGLERTLPAGACIPG
ncbi:MarP family serine protease [Micrococcus cohnii]|uniref:S1-C subfamily serine protease n=1 Tax=Micrococcus cohnii TaxID=993416 RepID=A0A7W7GPH3_9MICC|nr:MarP family serine protease [Micrococcus cohnii]MBB4735864.1 S1-C subfamily serine protease [Micrococcus cohnii]